jgi:hypothetical protein
MEQDTITHVSAMLEDAIDKVFKGTATLAQFSKRRLEEHLHVLAPARVAIYATLQAIYADRPMSGIESSKRPMMTVASRHWSAPWPAALCPQDRIRGFFDP